MFGDITRRKEVPSADGNGTYLFVYGTLMTDQPNHWLMAGLMERNHATLVSDKAQAHGVALANIGLLPAAFGWRGTRPVVTHGELYVVTGDGIMLTDALEGHPAFYRRNQWRVEYGDRVVIAYSYQGPVPGQADETKPFAVLAGVDDDGMLTCDWRKTKYSDISVFYGGGTITDNNDPREALRIRRHRADFLEDVVDG